MSFVEYKAGIYVRLSREDENKESKHQASESIKNQKEFLKNYALENNFQIIDYYADDGISGTTFEREEFNRMLKDIENRKINMVLTKDLSRLGRDYIQTGYYLEKYFPLKNVRFIAVNDNYDSELDNSNNEMAPFKSVFNDMYAKDISKKVRASLKTKQIKGEFLGTTAPYGFKKDPEHKGKLIIDEVSSRYVKKIFNLYLSGKSILEITNQLSKEKIPIPSEYMKMNNSKKDFKGIWSDKSVRFILQNEAYIGNTVQNKKKKASYKIKKQIDIPKDNWIKVENTHEPIIENKTFQNVQHMLRKNGYRHLKSQSKLERKNHLLSGLIFCGNCNAPMTFIPGYKNNYFYIGCSTAKRYKKELGLCKMNLIREEEIERKIIDSIKQILVSCMNKSNVIKKINTLNFEGIMNQKQEEILKWQNEQNEIETISFNLYKDKVKGIIKEEQFLQMSNQIKEERRKYNNKIKKLKKEIDELQKRRQDTKLLDHIINRLINLDFNENMNRNILMQLIKKVVINLDGSMKIYFTFIK